MPSSRTSFCENRSAPRGRRTPCHHVRRRHQGARERTVPRHRRHHADRRRREPLYDRRRERGALPLRWFADQTVLRRLAQKQRLRCRRARRRAAFCRGDPRVMPSYVRTGSLPHKRHIQFRRPDGGLYAEELVSTKGFESVYSLLYHVRPPTATLEVRAWERPAARFVANDPLRNRHFRTQHVQPAASDAVESRTVVLGNDDLTISVLQADGPMEYFYRNTGGDELFFIHHGSGVFET